MINNQEELNRLVNQLSNQKSKDQKYHLRIEIAKASDRTVKRALEDILEDIEKKERRKRLFIFIAVMILLGAAVLVYFYSLGAKGDKKVEQASEQTVESTLASSSQIEDSSTTKETKEAVIKEKNLTTAEVKQWVDAVLAKRNQNIAKPNGYELEVQIDQTDQLLYIRVAPPKGVEIDTLGSFRINAKGELEEAGFYVDGASIGDWITVSKNYMDVSLVESRTPPTPTASTTVSDYVTAQEFAALYAKWDNNDFPIMHVQEYAETYLSTDYYDESLQVISYSDREDNIVQCGVQTPYKVNNFYYTYNNSEQKAYINRNDASQESQYSAEFTEFIATNK